MSAGIAAKGRCLCGAVRFSVKTRNNEVGACHCNMCRSWGGGPLMAIDCGSNVLFEGDENISVFASSDWAERGFCRQCGSHLFYRLKDREQYHIPVGLLESCEGLVFTHQVFIDEKPALYSFSNKTTDLTGAEVFEKYAPSGE